MQARLPPRRPASAAWEHLQVNVPSDKQLNISPQQRSGVNGLRCQASPEPPAPQTILRSRRQLSEDRGARSPTPIYEERNGLSQKRIYGWPVSPFYISMLRHSPHKLPRSLSDLILTPSKPSLYFSHRSLATMASTQPHANVKQSQHPLSTRHMTTTYVLSTL
jgi:hypothetical protein